MPLIALKLEKTRLEKQWWKRCRGKMWALISEACCCQIKISFLLGYVPLFRSQWFQLRPNLLPSDTPFTLWGRGNIQQGECQIKEFYSTVGGRSASNLIVSIFLHDSHLHRLLTNQSDWTNQSAAPMKSLFACMPVQAVIHIQNHKKIKAA